MIYGANETRILAKTANSEQQCTVIGEKRQMARFEGTILKLNLSVYEKMVYVVLCSQTKKDGYCCPSIKTLARYCSCSSRQIMRALKTLEQRKIISRESQYLDAEGKTQTANKYTLHLGRETGVNA